ncbi:MAG TPA: LamG-like jellyroll fold domain-containing protein, partial [Planctomycetota bacterium]|nr:LamG-like jellyroll fold domain-containing protein [Planctomycetota bacterium]
PKPDPRETPAPVAIRPDPKPAPVAGPLPEPAKTEPLPPAKAPVTVAEVATLESVEGEVTLGEGAAKPGPLTAGFVLETKGVNSAAVFRYPDGTRVELAGLSRAQDEPTLPGHVLLVAGMATAEVAKQPADRPMLFLTAHAEARVLGTKLRIETAGDSTRLEVTEGRVRLTRTKDKASVEVAAGHYAIAAPSGSMTSRLARTSTGLVALYAFKEGKGGLVHDSSRAGAPLDLKIENEAAVKWSPKGLLIGAPVLISSTASAAKIAQACKASNEVTVEAWVRPGTLTPSGKDGRIVGLSADTQNQNFLLGQDQMEGPARSYFMRLRSATTDTVGKPALATPDGSARLKLSHLVYTRSTSGVATFYIDGVEVARTTGGGALSNWNEGYRLSVGNEISGDRPWLGEVHLVAVYSHALTADELKQNFKAGSE